MSAHDAAVMRSYLERTTAKQVLLGDGGTDPNPTRGRPFILDGGDRR